MKLYRESIPMIPDNKRFLVAFSGGIDSLYLLSILPSDRTTALYVNHNLRSEEELRREIALNKKNAAFFGIPLVIKEVEKGLIVREAKLKNIGVEAAARNIRYSILSRYREENNFDYILTAHHRDDQCETLLMRMLSYSPFWAWGGIRERDSYILRPILSTSKNVIRESIKKLGLEWSEDSTNSDTSFFRNNVRKNLLPLLGENEKELLVKIASNVAQFKHLDIPFISNALFASFSCSSFLSANECERERLIYALFSSLGKEKRVSRRFIKEVERVIENKEKRVETDSFIFITLKDEVRVYKKIDDFSFVYSSLSSSFFPFYFYKSDSSLSLEIPESVLIGSTIRKNRKGDSIVLKDGRRKISSLNKEKKIPYSLVCEKNGEIVAYFASFFGERDRLSSSLRGKKGIKVSIGVAEN